MTIDDEYDNIQKQRQVSVKGKKVKKNEGVKARQTVIFQLFLLCLSARELSMCACTLIYSMSVPETSATCRIIYHS